MAAPILQDRPITARDALVPYTIAGLNILSPIVAAGLLNVLKPDVFVASVLIVLIGLPLSVFFRQRRTNRFWLYFLTTTILIVLAWALAGSHPGLDFDWRDPIGSLARYGIDERFRGMLQIVSLFIAGHSFQLLASRNLVQTPIPGFSMYFMVAYVVRSETMDARGHGGIMLVSLAVLCATTLYLLAHEQGAQWVSIQLPPRLQHVVLRRIAVFMLVFFPVAALLGWLASPLNGPQLAARHRQATLPNLSGFIQSLLGNRTGVGLSETVRMDGGNWPRGKQAVMTVTTSGRGSGQLWRGVTYPLYSGGEWKRMRVGRDPVRGTDFETWGRGTRDVRRAWVRVPAFVDSPGAPGGITAGGASDPVFAAALNAGLVEPPQKPEIGTVPADASPMLDQRLERLRLRQHVKLAAPVIGEMPIYGALQIEEVGAASNGLTDHAIVASDGAVVIPPKHMAPIANYEVVSLIKPAPGVLRLPKPLSLDPELERSYLQMPGLVQGSSSPLPGPGEGTPARRIREKADAILAEAGLTATSDRLAIVNAFQVYLAQHYRYNLSPKPMPAEGGDPTVHFLYVEREGYCVYFASAFVLLCRSVGIPARFVAGYASGTEESVRAPNGDVTFAVTSEDAHAWAEVFLLDYGWHTVDPTAGSVPVPSVWQRAWNGLADAFDTVRGILFAAVTLLREEPRLRAYLLLAIAVLLVAAAGLVYWRRERPPRLSARPLTDVQARDTVLASYARMLRWLRLWGVVKPDGMTASVFQDRLRALNTDIATPTDGITGLYLQAHYGEVPIGDADARRANALLHELWQVGRRERRRLHAHDMEAQDA